MSETPRTIRFTMKNGAVVLFNDLTGMYLRDDLPEEDLRRHALTAMKVDDQIASYEIVEVPA